MQGPRGTVAIAYPLGEGTAARLWFSADGSTWEAVQDVPFAFDLDAGDEGFVISGTRGEDDPDAVVMASSDGREWIAASTPPDRAGQVAALGGDWFLLTQPRGVHGEEEHADAIVWHSANGLEWSQIGSMPRAIANPEGNADCREYVADALGAGSWVVVNTTLSYPCSEGAYVTHGTQRITSTGTSWFDLPFSTGAEVRGESAVFAGVASEGRLILVGQSDLKASFWLGE